MGERPMTSVEVAELRKRLSDAEERHEQLDLYVSGMGEDLRRGTAWQYDPEAFKGMCAEVKEYARGCREKSEREEVAKYGRVLEHGERQGWKPLPPELGNK